MSKTRMKISAAAALMLICAAASAQPPDTLDIKRTLQLKSPLGNSAIPGKLRIFEAANSGSQRIEFRTPLSMPVNVNLILPITQPSSGNVLTALTSDSLGWSTPSGTGDITGVAAGIGLAGGGIEGDVTLNVIYAATAGNADTLTLHDFISGAPNTDDVIKWNGAQWIPSATAGGIDSTEWPATDYQVSLRQSKGDTATYDATKAWVLGKNYLIASDISGKQDDSDTTAFDASKAWVTAKNYLTSADIAAKQDDADTTGFDASKTWVTGKNYLVASDIAGKQDDSDTTSFDATKTWVFGKNYLIASDIAAKQDDADTNTFDATKTWVNARGFLTSETGDISEVVAGGGLSGGGNSGSVTLDLNPKLSGQTIAITADSAHVKAASLDSSHIKNASVAGSDIASGTITGGKVATNALGPTQIDETASYFFSNPGNAVRALALRPDTLALRGAVTITSVNDTVIFRKANGALAFKVYTGASPTTDQILKANGNKVLVFAADATGGGGGGGNFRIRDDGSALSSSPESIDFRAGLQGIAAGTDSIEIFVLANKGVKASTDSLGILRTARLSGLAFKSDSVLVDTASVVIQTKTEVASQITGATATKQDDADTSSFDASKTWVFGKNYLVAADIASKQDDSDTTSFDATKAYVNGRGFIKPSDSTATYLQTKTENNALYQAKSDTASYDASKTWVSSKNYLVAADIASKQDDADTTAFDASKAWVLAKNYLVAGDVAAKQDDSDTTAFDASKTWVLNKSYLVAGDVASKQDDSDTTSFDATKTWVNSKGFLTTVDSSSVTNGSLINADIRVSTLDSTRIKNSGVAASDLSDGAVLNAKLAGDAVTNAKLANMAQNTIKMRVAAGAGDPEDIDISAGLTLVTAASGDYVVIEDATDGNLKRVNAADFLGGGGFIWSLTGQSTAGDSVRFINGTGINMVQSGNTLTVAAHAAVTLAGEDYLSLSGQEITAVDIDSNNIAAGGITTTNYRTASITATAIAADAIGASEILESSTIDWTAAHTWLAQNGIAMKPWGSATGATSPIRFRELAATGSNYSGWKAADAYANNHDYTMPRGGTSGQVLTLGNADSTYWATGGGSTAWSAIGDATTLGTIDFAGFDQDIVSAEDGGDILTVTNSDAVHAATSRILVLADNDAASASAVYLQMIGDADGTPTNDYVFSQTGFTSLLAVNVPAEVYDATNWDADTGAPQKDAVRDALEGYTGRNTIVTVGTVANGTWNATAIDEAKLDLTLTTTALNASGVTATLGTVAGAIDAGGATSLEIPNAANPSTTVEGQIAWDSNNDALEVHNGTDSRILTIRIKSIQATIVDPDVVQPITDAVSIFSVETEMFPFGITLISCGIKTNVSSTYAVNFEEWTSPTDAAPSTIEAVTTSTSTEAEDDGTLTDASIAAGSIIKVDLPTTDIAELVVWITYVINEGN